jgi:hypothetical protein
MRRRPRILATVVLSGICGLVVAQARRSPSLQPGSSPKGYQVQEIRLGVYWVTDGLYNTMFVISSNGVIAVDPLPSLRANYLKAIAEVTDKPITHVI